MRTGLAAAMLGCLLLQTASAEERRELGAHQHGHGTLNIAFEGNRITMELEVPGHDIVGFEHEAKTDDQKAAVAKAKSQLGAPLALFQLPAAAGCTVKEAHFSAFKGAEELKVNLITSKGQNKFEVKRDNPRLDLSGIM